MTLQDFATISANAQATVNCPPDIQRFLIEAVGKKKASLIPFTLQSPAALEVVRHLKRDCSQSHATTYLWLWGIQSYCTFKGTDPDTLIAECLNKDGTPNDKALKLEVRTVGDYKGYLQDQKLSDGHIGNCIKGVKCLFATNGLTLPLPRMKKKRVTSNQAPTIEELRHLFKIADPRGKVIIALLALSGFRIGTLVKLCYRHIKEDFEKGTSPIHFHIEAAIVKGRYADYDTFARAEAVEYLKEYIAMRKAGGLKIPPETFTDDTPLIRDEHCTYVKPITEGQCYNIVHGLMAEAGMLGTKIGKRYKNRPHNIRSFFRTQLAAKIPIDDVEYFMGHVRGTYTDVASKGIEALRAEYENSGFAIMPEQKTTPEQAVMAAVYKLLEQANLKPNEILTKQAQAMPHRTSVNFDQPQSVDNQASIMLEALTAKIKQEVLAELKKVV